MIRINETFYYNAFRKQLVEPGEIQRYKRVCAGFCEGCNTKLGGCEDDQDNQLDN